MKPGVYKSLNIIRHEGVHQAAKPNKASPIAKATAIIVFPSTRFSGLTSSIAVNLICINGRMLQFYLRMGTILK